ncbi:MAG: alpha/beta hydrolase [Actinomycetaceae bacterium]|nr:alpha/beta hydrolase [Arcanobacterium sp.]MDD7504433.1 alpha/beta hydrolase [Actinomycetaceae bacterium]MDY6143377.1 alpha/beta hydrolase [Arcanobacterium sp.]
MNTLSFRRSGTASDAPLVLLHALPLDSTMWDGVRSALTEAGEDVDLFTPDSPGFGDSGAGSSFSEPRLATYVEALKATLDARGISRIVLGGLSMGGSAAAQFALAYPEMVIGLALMDTNIAADNDAQSVNRLAMAEKAEAGQGYEAVRNWTTTMLSPQATQQVREDLDRRLRSLPDEGLAWEQRAMASRPDSTAAVELDVPLMLLRGADDPTCSLEYLESLAKRAKDVRIIEVANASHFSALEQPEELAQHLSSFYRRATA